MATKKTAKKKTTAEKPVVKPAKTTVITRKVAPSTKQNKLKLKKPDTKLPSHTINIVLAEAIGTFVLTLVILYSVASTTLPLYVGLAFAALILIIGNISGSHLNPAVTFGLWTARKLKTVLVPFYWAAQLLGGVAAVVLINALSGGSFSVHFDNFAEFSAGVFAVELIGTAIFLFGLTAVVSRLDLSNSVKALGIGLSLAVGMVVSTSLMPYVQRAAFAEFQKESQASEQTEKSENDRAYPREVYINTATLNPAAAIAATELTDSQIQGSSVSQETEKAFSRFGLETIFATLIGAAIGANLYLLVSYRAKVERV